MLPAQTPGRPWPRPRCIAALLRGHPCPTCAPRHALPHGALPSAGADLGARPGATVDGDPPMAEPRIPPRRGLTRRDVLRVGPGAAAAMALGCGPRPPASTERALDAGAHHRHDRGAPRTGPGIGCGTGPVPEPREVRDIPVVIVGGGVAGLSAAWKLARSGLRDFVVLELEPDAGGNARWGGEPRLRLPLGRATICRSPPPRATATRELVAEMGLILDTAPTAGPSTTRGICATPPRSGCSSTAGGAGGCRRATWWTPPPVPPRRRNSRRSRRRHGGIGRLPGRAGAARAFALPIAAGAADARDRRARPDVDARVLRPGRLVLPAGCAGTSTTAAATTSVARSRRPPLGRRGTTSARAPTTSST